MTHLALVLVRAGYGNVSFLEAFWLLVGLACLRDSACLLWDARQQLAAATAAPIDETLRDLAVMDAREALQAVLVQLCFLGVGLIAAVRPPRPVPENDDEGLVELATIGFLVAVQVLNAVGAHERHRYLARIDRGIKRALRVTPKPGGKRWYDPPSDAP